MNGSFFSELLTTITDRGRSLLARPWTGTDAGAPRLEDLCRKLVSRRGEASGVALAREIFAQWDALTPLQQCSFLVHLAQDFGPDTQRLNAAIDSWRTDPAPRALLELHSAAEPKRQEIIRRLNLAPGGTRKLVQMREAMFAHQKDHPVLDVLDMDFVHLLSSWFNRGFLVLKRIDWSTPASILEKIIRYEAVHEISDWDELRRRIEPEDRRLFAFFHPQIVDDPLIFVEVALTNATPGHIGPVLAADRKPMAASQATTAVFYSISNCQEGLRGVSFGSFLIKQVVEDLQRELPNLSTFVTLSPVPGFAGWLNARRADGPSEILTADDLALLEALDEQGWGHDAALRERMKPALDAAAAHYFLRARDARGRIIDPVARFHLGNGACLEQINQFGDMSTKGRTQAFGLMVNYLYNPQRIEANHEAFAESGEVIASREVRRKLRQLTLMTASSPAKLGHAV